MSDDSRELIEVLLSLSPWLAFFVVLAWATGRSFAARRDERGRHRPQPSRQGREDT